jgi:hypothetical protein
VTGAQMAADMSKALNVEVAYNVVSPEVFRGFGFPGADDLGNMFQYYTEFEKEFTEARSLDTSRSLNPELLDFKSWLAKYKDRIPSRMTPGLAFIHVNYSHDELTKPWHATSTTTWTAGTPRNSFISKSAKWW